MAGDLALSERPLSLTLIGDVNAGRRRKAAVPPKGCSNPSRAREDADDNRNRQCSGVDPACDRAGDDGNQARNDGGRDPRAITTLQAKPVPRPKSNGRTCHVLAAYLTAGKPDGAMRSLRCKISIFGDA